jgi:hypothetical protein
MDASELKEFAPELSSLSGAYLDIWIEMAGLMIDEGVFGTSYEMALKALSAHFAVRAGVMGGANGGGPVTSEREGDIAISYGSSADMREDNLNSTGYGQMYLAIRNRTVSTPLCV